MVVVKDIYHPWSTLSGYRTFGGAPPPPVYSDPPVFSFPSFSSDLSSNRSEHIEALHLVPRLPLQALRLVHEQRLWHHLLDPLLRRLAPTLKHLTLTSDGFELPLPSLKNFHALVSLSVGVETLGADVLAAASALPSLETLGIVALKYPTIQYGESPIFNFRTQFLSALDAGGFTCLKGVSVHFEDANGEGPRWPRRRSWILAKDFEELVTLEEELLPKREVELWVGEDFEGQWRKVSRGRGKGDFALSE